MGQLVPLRHGFASQGAETSGVSTVEAALFTALKKVRLIADDASWKTCDYTRCGRTDAGVSALGQVISVRVRSKIPLVQAEEAAGAEAGAEGNDEEKDEEAGARRGKNDDGSDGGDGGDGGDDGDDEVLVIRDVGEGYVRRKKRRTKPAPPPPPSGVEELDYPAVINRSLPDDIRVLGWSYVDQDFSSRFDCQYRHYKYFFGAWGGLDLGKMREAARWGCTS
jgi:tRNA pseudouridine38/39 synthase